MRTRKLVPPIIVCAVFAFSAIPASTASAAAAAPPTLEEVDGGPGWYGGFSNPLPTEASYFPIGVWFESVLSQADVDKDKDVGLNTYVVLTTNSNLALLRTNGMRAFVQQDQWLTSTALGTETPGWLLNDEIDMEMSPDAGFAEVLRLLGTLPADGRLRFNNYGKGVMFWETDTQAARYVNAVHLASNDIYWFTDPNVCGISEGGAMFAGRTRALTAAECRRAANYGYVVDRMRALVSPARSRPVWTFVEVGHPFTESSAPTIQAPEIRAAVWHSLIAGARGIIYFNHNFGGSCISQHVLRDGCGAAVRPTVKAVNEQVRRLAPVLNAPSVAGLVSTAAQVRTLAKYQGGKFYVFAGNRELGARTATFEVPCVGDATVTVVDEGRTIALAGGRFTDSFADGNAVHIYRIDGGSTCGLPPGVGSVGSSPGSRVVPRRTRVGRLPRRVSLRSGRLVVRVTCTVSCKARSRLSIRRGSRRVLLAANQRRFGAGRHKLILRLSRRDRRRAVGRVMRLRTVIVESGSRVQRTQRLMARRR